MATLIELKQNRNKLLTDAQQILTSKAANAETRIAANKMIADADELDVQIGLEERIAKTQSEERNSTRPPRSQPGDQGIPADAEKQKMAFRDWMRTGHVSQENRSYLRQAETRDLGVGTTAPITAGAVLVPSGFDPQLHISQKSYGALVGAVRQFKTDDGRSLKVSLADDTAQGLTVIGEAIAVTENDPNLSGFTSNVDELTTGLVKVSNSLLQDSAFDVDDFIQNTFAARYYKGLSKMISIGNGSNIAAITAGATLGATSTAPTVLDLPSLIAIYGALDAAYLENASWLMSSTVRSGLMGLTDNYGHPILQADLTGQPFNALFGRPIVLSPFMPSVAATTVPILFGDLTSYTLRTVAGGLQVVRLTERYAELNETGFIGYTRAGGYNTSQAASPSIVSLKMHS
ncbi:HK97 family phage major capsid protein [Granulicella aggregans]|uniref:HK97 family phage major capsid protein n=1 Tax=Granulicella aggregans TaxID=474949 RepID=A0A7W7ZA83_9BACT|nr:phage major capsid protein [Granulicella aggregans]MBB5056068.1 HK97 family phage major capsid protein [Granulicella aggregans]